MQEPVQLAQSHQNHLQHNQPIERQRTWWWNARNATSEPQQQQGGTVGNFGVGALLKNFATWWPFRAAMAGDGVLPKKGSLPSSQLTHYSVNKIKWQHQLGRIDGGGYYCNMAAARIGQRVCECMSRRNSEGGKERNRIMQKNFPFNSNDTFMWILQMKCTYAVRKI